VKIKKIGTLSTTLIIAFSSLLGLALPQVAFAAPAHTCTWTAGSGGGNANFSDAANWSGCNGAAPLAGDDDNLVFNTNTPLYNNPNNDITGLTVNNIHFLGTSSSFWYSLAGNSITLTGGVTDDTTSEVTGITNPLIISGSQTFSTAAQTHYSILQGSGNVTVAGGGIATFDDLSGYTGTLSSTTSNVQLQTYTSFTSSANIVISGNAALTLDDESNRDADALFTLPISIGGAGISKIDALNLAGQGNGDSVTLAGPVSLTSDVGVTADGNTTLNITGTISYNGHTISSDGPNVTTITVGAGSNQSSQSPNIGKNVTYIVDGQTGATTIANGGLLKGSGSLAKLAVQPGATVAPGHSPGCLEVDDGLTMSGIYNAQVQSGGGAACSDYDQISAGGLIDLTSGTLDLQFLNNFNPAVGQSYEIIKNQSNVAISGNFNNLPEGDVFLAGSIKLRITYQGGDGNNVVVTVVDPSTTLGVPTAPNTGFGSTAITNPLVILTGFSTVAASVYVAARRIKKASV
jgi:hypothetical protein